MKTATLLGVVALVMLGSFIFVPALGALLFISLIVGGAIYYGRPKCGSCGARGMISQSGTEIVSSVPGFGIVTRTDTITTNKRRSSGSSSKEVRQVNRQERVPTVTNTIRTYYKCSGCANTTYKDRVTQVEDFSRSGHEQAPTVIKETTVIQKEVLKVPCKYCGTLQDPLRERYCTSCGSSVKI
ncbi:MAG: hypothetical protein ABSB53_03585 [Nitrososphaerales archaeon]